MYIYDETGSYYFDDAYYYTSYYYLSDFDPIGAYFEPPYDDYGVDADSDGLYDALVVTVYVTASSTGHYDLGVDVYDPWYNYAYSFWLELYLVEGTVTGVDLEIDSYTVWNQDVNGYWYFEAYLYDHYLYTEYDYDSFTTAGYYYVSDFDPPAVLFSPPHNDYGLDVDSDYLLRPPDRPGQSVLQRAWRVHRHRRTLRPVVEQLHRDSHRPRRRWRSGARRWTSRSRAG